MRPTNASHTAGWVAAARSFGPHLPPGCQLVSDPYGIRFAAPWMQRIEALCRSHPDLVAPLWARSPFGVQTALYMQVRTRFIDDALRVFARTGGTQVVLLGAGYDSRALRLKDELPTLRYFEVDHPATQAVKRGRLPELASADVRFLAWNFLVEPMASLPAALLQQGHDPALPTLTIWEGVTMYLDPPAIETSVAAVAEYSAPGSPFVFSYRDRRIDGARTGRRPRLVPLLVASVGEPFRFGWAPDELPGWLDTRGFHLQEDRTTDALASRMLAAEHARRIHAEERRFALALRR